VGGLGLSPFLEGEDDGDVLVEMGDDLAKIFCGVG
jgi:hypothetical protein